MSDTNIPGRTASELNLNPVQQDAINFIGLVLEGRYEIRGFDADDHSKFGIVNPDDDQQGRPFRVNEDGSVVMMAANGDGATAHDIPTTKPMDFRIFAIVAMSYDSLFAEHPERNGEFVETAAFAVALPAFADNPGLLVEVIRAGARDQGLLADE